MKSNFPILYTIKKLIINSYFYIIPALVFLVYMIFLVVTHNNIVRIGAFNGDSILIPVPMLLIALHLFLVAFSARANDWRVKLYCIGLSLSGWGTFIYSTRILVANGIQVNPLVTKPLVILFILATTFAVYFFTRARREESLKRDVELDVVKQENDVYIKKEAVRKVQEAKFKSRLDAITSDFVVSVNQVIVDCLGDPSLDTKAIAAKLHMTEKTFSRKFKTQFGVTPGIYLKRFRMEKAYEYYINKIYPSQKALSAAVGFKSPTYFAKQLQLYIESEKTGELVENHTCKAPLGDSPKKNLQSADL